jgi:hypothetical protein
MAFSRDALVARLADGPVSSAELIRVLRISQPALSRGVQGLQREGLVLKIGTTRGARYGLRRVIPNAGSSWPVYRIDDAGAIHGLGSLHALEQHHYYVDGEPARLRGVTAGIPYFLQDARPAGFLGRAIPAAYPELALPSRVIDWNDDHYLAYLTRRGWDTGGDLVVGSEALDSYLSSLRARRAVAVDRRASEYPALARAAMGGAPPGSSVHGEHPKFTVLVADGETRTHMIVKFSPPRATAVGRRWSDLLVAEHVAHRILAGHGIGACRSAIVNFEDRTFLEVERFDRIGEEGRRGVVSLLALDATRYGQLDRWGLSAARLGADGLLAAVDVDRICLLDAFGMLIANTDRHFGNLALFDGYDGRYELAPVYDMLPMLFAPQNEQIIERTFEPTEPTSDSLAVWPRARALAETYWAELVRETQMSGEFRDLSAQALRALQALPNRAAFRAAG